MSLEVANLLGLWIEVSLSICHLAYLDKKVLPASRAVWSSEWIETEY
jgi:hypothetical protein